MVEVWTTDLQFYCLQPGPSVATGTSRGYEERAGLIATYTICAAIPFTKAQARYMQDLNLCLGKALRRWELTAISCALIVFDFSSEPDAYREICNRSIAIPFGPMRWERESVTNELSGTKGSAKRMSVLKRRPGDTHLCQA